MRGSIRVTFAGLLSLAGGFSSRDALAGDPPRLAAAIPAINATIAASGADVAVVFSTLDGRTRWSFHAD